MFLAACGGTGPEDQEATGNAPSPRNASILTEDVFGSVDVRTWIGQPRHLEGTRRVTVPVLFESDEPVTVTSIALRVPQFDPLAPETKDSLLHPRLKVALQVDLGPARCGRVPQGSPRVHLEAGLDDGRPEALVLPVPSWLLDDLHERECTLAALADAVGVRFGQFDEPAGTSLRTELVLERRDTSEEIVVEQMAGSVILGLAPRRDGTPPGRLGADQGVARIPVEVTAARCDAHALSGSQKTFVFAVWVAVGDAPSVYVELRPRPELEAAMRATIEACIDDGT